MTPEEWRAGLIRLGVVIVLLVLAVLGVAALLAEGGRPFGRALGAVLGGAAVLLLICGVAAHSRTRPLERVGRPGVGEPRLRDAATRRESERIALGLVVLGLVCGGLALLLG